MEKKSDHDTILSPNPFTKIPGSWIRLDEYKMMKEVFDKINNERDKLIFNLR